MQLIVGQSLQRGVSSLPAPCCHSRQPNFRAQPLVSRGQQSATPSQRCTVVYAAAAADAPIVETSATEVAQDENDPSSWPSGVARLRGVRGSPFKFRRVIDQIRGRSYDEALFLLDNLPYRACEDILATLISAASNAKNNSGATKRNLVVEECFVDDAGMYKRFQPRAKGRPFKIQVKKSHITIKVKEYPDDYWVSTEPQQQKTA